MSGRASKMKLIVIDDEGNEKVNYLYGIDVRKARKAWNQIEQYHDEVKEVDGKSVTTRVYCNDKETEGYGWAEQMKPILATLFEEEKAYYPENKSTPDELLDAICADDMQLINVFWGNAGKKVDGYFQVCRESKLKLV